MGANKDRRRGERRWCRVRRLLALWYLRGASGIELTEYVRPFKKAVEFLISDLPEDRHMGAFATVLNGLEREFITAGSETPRWLTGLQSLLPGELLRSERLTRLPHGTATLE